MTKEDNYSEDFDEFSDEEEFSSYKAYKHNKDNEDWLNEPETKKKKRRSPRWRDIESELEKKALKKQYSWKYGDYDF